MAVWADARDTVRPPPGARDGPLPPMLLTLTAVTGLVDAASYLRLGHVFVANMTGNVVFLGFAVAGAAGLSVWASLLAIVAFVIGAAAAGRIHLLVGPHRGRLVASTLTVQVIAIAASAAVAAGVTDPPRGITRYVLIAVLAIAMGIQGGTARRLAVADLNTTVLTQTLIGIAADSPLAGASAKGVGRRVTAVLTMLAGAVVGGLLAIHSGTAAPLLVAAGVVVVLALVARRLARSAASWAA